MAHILFLSYFFTPDNLSTAVLMAELAQDLQTLGHQVTVVTTTPHYNLTPEGLMQQPLRLRWGGWLHESDLHGIRVLHVPVAPKGSRVWTRIFDYLRYHGIGTLVGWLLVQRPNVLLVPSPPLTIGVQAWLLSRLHRVPFIYNVQEIYPDVAVRLGVLRNRRLIQTMEWIERFIYSRAWIITVISEWFFRALMAKGVPSDAVRVIPNFADTELMKPGERPNAFSVTHNLDGKFVVLYAGNIGLTQDFESVLAAAECLEQLPNLQFVIVGGGARWPWLQDQLNQRRIRNVTLLPHRHRSQMPAVYASSDLCLVPMKAGMAQETFPSKIYTIMAAGRAAIVSSEADSELSWVVETVDCGWAIPPENAAVLSATIEHAYHHRAKCQQKGQRGRIYVVAHRSHQAIAQQYHRLIAELTSNSGTF